MVCIVLIAETLNGAIDNINTQLNSKQNSIIFDDTPTANSNNAVKSSGIKSAIDNLQTQINSKQGTLTIDTTLNTTSTNPVQNKVINSALNSKLNTSALTTTINSSSTDAQIPTAKAVNTMIGAKQNGFTTGSTITSLTDTTKISQIDLGNSKINKFTLSTLWNYLKGKITLLVYPVGAIYISVNSTSPATLFGGTWEQIKDRFLLSAGGSYTVNSTGGNTKHTHTTASHTLTVSEIPSHNHTIAHTHTRGTMEISGAFWTRGVEINSSGGNGVFSVSGNDSFGGGHENSQQSIKVSFAASKNWTGSTSSPSNANSGNVGGGGGHSHGNTGESSSMPPYIAVYMWKRTK